MAESVAEPSVPVVTDVEKLPVTDLMENTVPAIGLPLMASRLMIFILGSA